jgi:predicted  nucleic acid-binding Zn-ribbon protein
MRLVAAFHREADKSQLAMESRLAELDARSSSFEKSFTLEYQAKTTEAMQALQDLQHAQEEHTADLVALSASVAQLKETYARLDVDQAGIQHKLDALTRQVGSA